MTGEVAQKLRERWSPLPGNGGPDSGTRRAPVVPDERIGRIEHRLEFSRRKDSHDRDGRGGDYVCQGLPSNTWCKTRVDIGNSPRVLLLRSQDGGVADDAHDRVATEEQRLDLRHDLIEATASRGAGAGGSGRNLRTGDSSLPAIWPLRAAPSEPGGSYSALAKSTGSNCSIAGGSPRYTEERGGWTHIPLPAQARITMGASAGRGAAGTGSRMIAAAGRLAAETLGEDPALHLAGRRRG